MSLLRLITFRKQPEQPTGIVTSGLTLHLDAGNSASYPGTGTTWTDLSGQGNDGTLVNGVGYSSNDGGYLTFDGSNDYVSTNYSAITGQNARTVSVWYKSNQTQNKAILGWGTTSNKAMWELLLYNGTVGIHLYNSGNEASTSYTNNAWQNITFTYSHPTIKSYMNGVYKSQYTFTAMSTGTTNTLRIGTGLYYSNFNGNIAVVLMYNKELTASEVQQNFDALKGRFGL